MKLITLLLFMTLSSFASEDTTRIDGTEDMLLKEKNESSGIYDISYKTSDDTQRLSAIYRTNTDTGKLSSLSAYEFSYAKKLDVFWLEFFYARTTGRFDALGNNNPNITVMTEESESSITTISTLGSGFSYRSRVIQELLGEMIDAERVFETTSTAMTYNSLSNSYYEKAFRGYGMRADYGIHYRVSPALHWGPHFSYNLAVVKKDPTDDLKTNSADRSLLLSWTTWGIDFSIYF